ncbi:MAG: FIST C-terminal domain-containing protein [Sulfurimicrobium sp.]|jgi:small ligand-binding sensory domain FIST|nr:FIST C-terminal domain-containing protein [Sulfurimicrobium sp.]MDO9189502.1 FIST C-terminal domain-containing protein [Sulfurimicrobium sp.]MDP1704639.1 FIST C-terminal domain-containing protein [Sulfurimicrobium sp.]MDP2198312.1 FIST C-terminal domain-containing protein [Sulfurimicrobium sp.]MDP2963054.1 FIST C-terminal domain-containing protein [Sulfurimicrobium sp.]
MRVATGLATSHIASEDLAYQAVSRAMEKAGISIASSVLLFLTPEFAREPQSALRAAVRAASCTQVIGCSAAGIFTEDDWVLDAPAAVAMVFGDGFSLEPAHQIRDDELLLTLAAPNAIHTEWLDKPGQRFGGVSGDATGQGPFGVWQGGRTVPLGRCELLIRGARGVAGVSQGVRPLSQQPFEITQASEFDVLVLAEQPALNVLMRELPLELREPGTLPLHLVMGCITYGDPATAIAQGRFRSAPIIAVNPLQGSVTLSVRPAPGDQLFWAMRQPLATESGMRATLETLQQKLHEAPDFGLCFSCMGRGPYFYGGVDLDLQLIQRQFPGMPLIGFYGNGEIAPFNGSNQLFQYAAVLGLFRHV